ncbi:MAG: hypothetical protein U1U88_001817 [Lawsonella clevelandensis]
MEHRDYRDQQGQLPPEIYRRRRIVAVAVIVVVLALIVWGIVAAVNKGEEKLVYRWFFDGDGVLYRNGDREAL